MKNETKKAKLQKGIQAIQARSQQNSQQELTQVCSKRRLPTLIWPEKEIIGHSEIHRNAVESGRLANPTGKDTVKNAGKTA